MEKLFKLLRWIDENLIKLLVFGFIFIAPLYPKFPLKFIDYTYIAVRLEDLYIVGFFILFLIQLIRKKITLNKKFLFLILAFWAAAFISFLYGSFVQQTIIYKHLGFLHFARRVEYMVIFLMAASTIRSRKDFLFYFYSLIIALTITVLYGLGQKFIGFPAVQTMNPEFAKGYILYLTPEARVSSTFAGHYDFAAYLNLFLPIVLGLFLLKGKLRYALLFLLSLFTLILTASRSGFIAYIVSITAFLVYWKKFRLLIFILILSFGLSAISKNLSSRFLQAVQIKQIFVNEKTGQVVVPQKISVKNLPAGSLYLELNKKQKQVTSQTEKLLQEKILADIRDEARKSGITLTATEEAALAASASAGLKPVNSVVSDISMATRIQVEWPRAIAAFLSNPILGKGPSTITEATDSDYLRWLGEFGLLGTSLFVFLLFSIGKFVWDKSKQVAESEKSIYHGFLFGFFALFIYAGYFDIFEASKVAYTFWTVAGTYVGYLSLKE